MFNIIYYANINIRGIHYSCALIVYGIIYYWPMCYDSTFAVGSSFTPPNIALPVNIFIRLQHFEVYLYLWQRS